MPLYEYECESCGQRLEKIQKFSDPPLEVCPNCAGALRKLLSSPAIQFKGSGWYITDYARKSSSDSASPTPATGKAADTTSADKKTDAPGAGASSTASPGDTKKP